MVSEKPKKKKKKKKSDPFWPIVIILVILAFTGSFWFFYMLTSKINTQSFPTTDTPKIMITPTPEVTLDGEGSLLVGENTPLPTPTPEATPTPESTALAQATAPPPPKPTPEPTEVPTPASTPTPVPTRAPATPAPAKTSAPVVTAAPVQSSESVYKVQVGSYTSREEADAAAIRLGEKGYKASAVERNGKFTLQLGLFKAQESALNLAEEVTQQGYEVVVRKSTP